MDRPKPLVEINKTHWMQLAEQHFPDQVVEAPADLYNLFAVGIVYALSSIDDFAALYDFDGHPDLSFENKITRAAYPIGYRAQLEDGATGQSTGLNKLADSYQMVVGMRA